MSGEGGEDGGGVPPHFLLTSDVARRLFQQFDISTLLALQLTCKHYAEVLSDDEEWKEWLMERVDFPNIPILSPPTTFRRIAIAVGLALVRGQERLASSVLGASSVDQDVEDPSNVLKWSHCTQDVRAQDGAPGAHASPSKEQIEAMRSSCRCDPASMGKYRPCYWSSLPTDDPATSEWIRIKLRSVACLVTEVSVFPYEAYWQPRSVDGRFPIYAPVEADFEFGTFGESGARVWARTRRELVPHDTSGMMLRLKRPMLVLGGEARLNLVGRVQRQTYEIAGEFYTCVQHVGMSGMRVVGLKAEAGVAEAGGWSVDMTDEKQCGMCGGFKGGRGAHKVEKLVKCGWCKTEWYCGKDCRELLCALRCM